MESSKILEKGTEYMVLIKDASNGEVRQRPNMIFIRCGEGFITFLNRNRNIEETFLNEYIVRIERSLDSPI